MSNKVKLSSAEFLLPNKKKINISSSTFIIAEIGINHEGNYNQARKLVDKAFNSGANAVKFQIVNPDHSYSKNTSSYKIYKNSLLSEQSYKSIIDQFNNRGVIFATPGDLESVKFCEKLKFKLYKVSSLI